MNMTDLLKRREDIIAAKMEESTVMLDSEKGMYYNLTGVGGVIWEMLAEEISFEELLSRLTARFDVPYGQCRQQTEEFLQQLAERGMVEVKDGKN